MKNSAKAVSAARLVKSEFHHLGDDLHNIGPGEEPFIADDPFLLAKMVNVAGPTMVGNGAFPIGHIKQLTGHVTATSKYGVLRTLKKDSQVFQGDTIKTEAGSLIKLTFKDDTFFQLGENAHMVLNKYVYNPTATQGLFEATIVRGVFKYISGDMAHLHMGRHTLLLTPSAAIGVRGSELQGEVTAEGQTTIVLISGVLDISNLLGLETVTLLQPGMATVVNFEGNPQPAFKASQQILDRLNSQLPNVLPERNLDDKGKDESKNKGKEPPPNGKEHPPPDGKEHPHPKGKGPPHPKGKEPPPDGEKKPPMDGKKPPPQRLDMEPPSGDGLVPSGGDGLAPFGGDGLAPPGGGELAPPGGDGLASSSSNIMGSSMIGEYGNMQAAGGGDNTNFSDPGATQNQNGKPFVYTPNTPPDTPPNTSPDTPTDIPSDIPPDTPPDTPTDTMNGNTGTVADDTIIGSGGNDVLDGKTGKDTLKGESGDDILFWYGDELLVDGGTGTDTLMLRSMDQSLDLTLLKNILFGIEKIDLTGNGNNTLSLSINDLLDLSDSSDQLMVDGDLGDVVNAKNSMNWPLNTNGEVFVDGVSHDTDASGYTNIGNQSYAVFQHSVLMSVLLVDTDITLNFIS